MSQVQSNLLELRALGLARPRLADILLRGKPMRRLLAGSLLLALAAAATGATVRLIEMRGHSRVLAIDQPTLKGRVLLFHRYPDGIFLSVPAKDVLGVSTTTIGENRAMFRPGETVVLGPTGEGRSEEKEGLGLEPTAPPALSAYPYPTNDLYLYGGCCSSPPPVPQHSAPALVGPNGYPGTPMREIGPNGFPLLAPSPPSSPR